jgi:hypothetical protein
LHIPEPLSTTRAWTSPFLASSDIERVLRLNADDTDSFGRLRALLCCCRRAGHAPVRSAQNADRWEHQFRCCKTDHSNAIVSTQIDAPHHMRDRGTVHHVNQRIDRHTPISNAIERDRSSAERRWDGGSVAHVVKAQETGHRPTISGSSIRVYNDAVRRPPRSIDRPPHRAHHTSGVDGLAGCLAEPAALAH